MKQVERLLEIMERLRDPQTGCPWDLKQNYKSLTSYTIEEAYEVAEAIEQGDMHELKDELGDLLFQIIFYAQLAKEQNLFDFEAIAAAVSDKMVHRHPHVFAEHQYASEAEFLRDWEHRKEQEKQKKAGKTNIGKNTKSLMDGIIKTLPAMSRAAKIQQRAARVGFDWQDGQEVIDKIKEELQELDEALSEEHSKERLTEEMGDILFSCVNLARKLEIDPEKALRLSNHKFSERFKKLEQCFHNDHQQMTATSIDELEARWQQVKQNNTNDH